MGLWGLCWAFPVEKALDTKGSIESHQVCTKTASAAPETRAGEGTRIGDKWDREIGMSRRRRGDKMYQETNRTRREGNK